MDAEWSDADRQVIDRARALAAASLASRQPATGFDREAWSACARDGLLSLALPEDWRGAGRSVGVTAAAFEALGRGGADRGLLFALGAHLFGCALPMVEHATPEQRDRFAPGLSSGDLILALAMTEHGAAGPAN